jgi:aminocarboxymuconate-semialdehyde decarboxylase
MRGIDVHTHFIPASFPPYAGSRTDVPWPSMAPAECGHAHVMVSGKIYRTVPETSWSGVPRAREMDEIGLARQVLSPMPELLSYWLPVDDGGALVRYLNDQLAELVASQPLRFSALGAVPLQDVDAAILELEYVVKDLRLPGVEIATHVNGVSIGDPRFLPFFAAAERMGAAIFVHALHPAGRDRLVGPAAQEQVVAFPGDVALGIASLITGGTLERLPGLRIAFSHGGGAFAMLLPRMQHAWHAVAKMKESIPHPPEEYARRLYYDTLTYSARSLRFAIDSFGADRMMMGTDYPFIIKDPDPIKSLTALGLDAATHDAILEGNARRFLAMSTP